MTSMSEPSAGISLGRSFGHPWPGLLSESRATLAIILIASPFGDTAKRTGQSRTVPPCGGGGVSVTKIAD